LVTSGVSAASIAFFARSLTEAGLSAAAVVFFRFAATVLITGRRIALTDRKRVDSAWAFVAGLALGLGWVGYVLAIERLPVPLVATIYMTYPAFTLLATWLISGGRPASRAVAGAALVLTGAFIAVGPADAGVGGWVVLLAVAAPVTFGLVVAVMSDRVHALQPVETIAATSLGAFVGLVPLVVAQPLDAVIPADARTWLLAIGIGLLTSLLPMMLFVVGAPVVGSARAAAAASLELPTVFLIAWVLLAEPPTLAQLAGGTVILLAIMVSPTRRAPGDNQPTGQCEPASASRLGADARPFLRRSPHADRSAGSQSALAAAPRAPRDHVAGRPGP